MADLSAKQGGVEEDSSSTGAGEEGDLTAAAAATMRKRERERVEREDEEACQRLSMEEQTTLRRIQVCFLYS